MEPKKKSLSDLIISFTLLIIILYFAIQLSICWDYTQQIMITSEKANSVLVFLDMFNFHISETPFKFEWSKEYSQKFITYGFLIWVIVVGYGYTSKKHYIAGKEYGTAKWGTLSDIKDLFASNIELEEIKKTKKMKYFFLRSSVKKKVLKECEIDGQAIYKLKKQQLDEEKEIQKRKGNVDKKQYNEKLKALKEEVKQIVKASKLEAWQPYKYIEEKKNKLKEIQLSQLTKREKEAKEKQIKEEYSKKIKEFYSGKNKIIRIHEKYKDADMLFTKTERISMYNYKLNNNTLVIGGSGSGKTRGFVMPNILQAHSSFVITDPKGEILEKAGYFLSKVKNYKIHVLNLDDKTLSDGYNPFCYIHPKRPGYEERVLTLIETIILNTDGGKKGGGSDPFWDKAERLFLQSVFFFTVDGFIEEERNMNTVLELIRMLKIAEDEDNFDSDLDKFASIFEEKYGSEHIGIQQYKEFREKASGKTAKSIVISAVARLAPFKTKAIREMFSYDSMHLERVGEEKTAIFVIVPPTDSTFNFIAGMLFTQLFQELQYCATQVHKHDGQRLPVPCRFILDEFANTCTIPNFVKILAYARSFGIGIVPILQSLDQIKEAYEKEWGVIVDNCNTLLYLGGVTHIDTLEYISKLLGKGTFDKKTTGRTRGRQGSSSQNFDVIGRDLLDPSEIRKLDKSKCLLIVGGRNPFYSYKYEYTSHPNYCYTSDANHNNSFRYEVKKTNKKVPHGEEMQPSDNAEVEIEEIKIDISPQMILNRMSRNMKHMIPVNDEELFVQDGEDDSLEKAFEELMKEDEIIELEVKKMLSQETSDYMKEFEKNKVVIDSNPISNIKRLKKNQTFMTIVSDEEMSVQDGEEVKVNIVEYLIKNDTGQNKEILGEVEELLEDEVPYKEYENEEYELNDINEFLDDDFILQLNQDVKFTSQLK